MWRVTVPLSLMWLSITFILVGLALYLPLILKNLNHEQTREFVKFINFFNIF